MVQPLPDPGQAVRTPVRLVDGPQTGQRRAAQRGQQLLPPELGRIVIERSKHAVDQSDAVRGSPALHASGSRGRIDVVRRAGQLPPGGQRGGDQRVQLPRIEQPGIEQFQVGQHPGRRVGQHGQRGEPARRRLCHHPQRAGGTLGARVSARPVFAGRS
ncbi:hypothetical protein [Streptomyces sp. NPDC053069]|uniref:hypothetical protein n=1 Tax=Streptomyces sp. NPDC053069 TaxID=3365695 RepID=UPI0037D2FC65